MEQDKLSVATMYAGAAIEAVDLEIQNAVNNIIDPNTQADKVREVILKIKIKPNNERNIGSVSFQADSKLAPAEARETSIFIERDKAGRGVAVEHFARQEDQGVLPIANIATR